MSESEAIIPEEVEDEWLQEHDFECIQCGARSRAGFVVPDGRCPESGRDIFNRPRGGHVWTPVPDDEGAGGSDP